jgi:hypothetical protein
MRRLARALMGCENGATVPVDVFQVACDNAGTLMRAAASGRGPISRSTADGT